MKNDLRDVNADGKLQVGTERRERKWLQIIVSVHKRMVGVA